MTQARDLKPCPSCKKSLGLTPVEIITQKMYVDIQAVQQYTGLDQFFGGYSGITDAMAPNTELVKKILVCMDCYVMKFGDLSHVIEE